jgi:RNA polymerase sigma factor (sigma-70 family)
MPHPSLGPVVRHLHELATPPEVREQSDRALLERFQDQHDPAAFTALVRRHGGMVWNVCRHVLSQEQDAEDAFQATFLVLVRQAGRLHRIESLAGWLHSVAYRAALRARRSRDRQRARDQRASTMTTPHAADDLAWREVQAILDEEIQHLPDKQRVVFVVCCLEGLSQAAAARQLGIPEGTVSSRLTHARRQLQKRLTQRGITLSAVLGALAVSHGVAAAAPGRLIAATVKLLMQGTLSSTAAAAATPAAVLAKGVLQAMFVSRLIVFGSALLVTASVAGTSVGVLRSTFAGEPPKVADAPPVVLAQAAEPPREEQKKDEKDATADAAVSVNHLKQLGLAMHNFHDAFGQFPPAAVQSKDGKSLLSWRVLVLPYLDQRELFKQFKLNEPWDSPHNKALLPKMPITYRAERGAPREPFTTYYQVFTGPGTIFDRPEGRPVFDITDGTSNTLLIAEGAEAVPWTKPVDLVYDPNKPLPKVGGVFQNGFHTTWADGSVHFLKKRWNTEQEKTMRELITRAGGEVISGIEDLTVKP